VKINAGAGKQILQRRLYQEPSLLKTTPVIP
jgi:hypothetical protein